MMDIRRNYRSRCISIKQASELIKEGYFAADLHCHTSLSYDVPDTSVTSPENVVKEQLWNGLRPVISDHDTMNGYYDIINNSKVSVARKELVIPAVEITIKPVKADLVGLKRQMHTMHVNVFGLNNEQLTELKTIAATGDLDNFVQYLKDNDLDYMYNHPFWHEHKERLNWKIIPGLSKHYFDVIELNAGRSRVMNDLALHLAEQFGKGIVASSDSHTGSPGKAFVLAEGNTFKEFWNNVKQGKMFIVRSDMTALGVVNETSAMITNIFAANVNASKDKEFIPSTGIRPVDYVVRAVTTGSLKDRFIIKKIMSMLLHTLNYSAGPLIAWKLYMSKQKDFADRFGKKIIRMTNSISSIQYQADGKER